MENKTNRRTFCKQATLIGASSILGGSSIVNFLSGFFNSALGSGNINISSVQGSDYFKDTIKAVELLGGINKFVSKDSTVGLLINSNWEKPGTYTKPDIALAVIKMCLDAGVKDIISLENVRDSYWYFSPLSKKYSKEIKSIKKAGKNYVKIQIPKGIALKEAEVEKALLDCNVFINVPVFKDHQGTKFTGNLKNLMGLTSRTTNNFFHFGSHAKEYYSDVAFLSQCIADINLIRKPDLCVGDATELITTNGPFGPGKIIKPQKVVAGTDCVAVDSYGATVLGFNGNDIEMIKRAYQHGIGEIDITKLKIKEVKI